MWVKRLRLKSYYSFKQSDWIELDPSFSVFVGANNSGKTALLKAFSSSFQNAPHRTADQFRDSELTPSSMEIDVSITLAEIFRRHSIAGIRPTFPGSANSNAKARVDEFYSDRNRVCILEAQRGPGSTYSARGGSSISEMRDPNQQTSYNLVADGDGWRIASNAASPDNLIDFLNSANEPPIFYFAPQRLHVGKTLYADQRSLNSDASNLPNVLLYLQTRRPRIFEQIIRDVAEITQSVKSFRAAPSGGDVEIIIWPNEDDSRSEYSFNLNESGTGIGQIISIITAVSTNYQAVIVIDEINTFLHPSATKRMISILKTRYSHHQYIISTHSSDVISYIGCEKIHLVKKKNFETKIDILSSGSVSDVKSLASELGFSMMDVFGHDRLIWVEGETEVVAFPYLFSEVGKILPDGLGFVPVSSASDFDAKGRSVKSILEIYQHVVRSAAPLLRGMAFGVDREGNSDDVVASTQRSKTKLRFLPRRCFECYLIHPEAIAATITELDGRQLSTIDVETFILQHGGDVKYKARSAWKNNLSDPIWLKKVDAANLIADCFSELTENRTEFKKTRDSVQILKKVLSIEPAAIAELTSYVEGLVEVALRDTPAR